MKNKNTYVWIVDRDFKGMFKPLKVLKSDADKTSLRQHKTKQACLKAIENIYIDQPYS